LNQIERKKALEISKDEDKNIIKNEELLAKDLSIKKEKLVFEIAQIEASIDKNNLELTKIESELKSSGADLLTNRHNLQEQQAILIEKNSSLNLQLVDLASEDAPLIFVQQLIGELREIKEKSSGFNKKSLALVEGEFMKASTQIKSLLTNDISQNIENLFSDRIKEIKDGLDEYAVEINTSEIPTNDELNELKQKIKSKLTDLNEVNVELELINKNLLAVPAEDKVKSIVEKLNLTQSNKDKNLGKLEVLRADYDQVTFEQDKVSKTLSAKLMDIANKKTNEIVSQRIINHSQKSRETLVNYKEALIQKHIVSLGEQITECFRLLHRKNKFELKFQIDPSDFNLNIQKNDGTIISAKTLSAGERQLLSVAILWALAKSSGKILPTVIDTPLGRLDGPHRQKLISNYFPKASSQVLIFSTDEEITPEHYLALKPFIASEYKINYSEDTESSSFEAGYFNEEATND
jgi:DNA sulfur modification protein DndD